MRGDPDKVDRVHLILFEVGGIGHGRSVTVNRAGRPRLGNPDVGFQVLAVPATSEKEPCDAKEEQEEEDKDGCEDGCEVGVSGGPV